MPKATYVTNNTSSWLRQREIGTKPKLGSSDAFHARVYSSLHNVASFSERNRVSPSVRHGGIFNMDFSPDGSVMVAACEKKCFIMLDPFSHKIFNGNYTAHGECVNCVRFIDSRLFVTCSDDTKIKIWDTRNIKNEIILLEGHMNWVKNIEYSAKDKIIVTSAFDGNIYAWDLNCSSGTGGYSAERVFQTSGLMRMRLNPDATKMVVSTTTGYMMVVHDLNLATMADDLEGFQPNIYRLSQMSSWNARAIMNYNYLFSNSRKRNRIEFISDFPKESDAEMISSLQIHPQGWCALSRNVNHKDRAEWTCVHDIHGDAEIDEIHQAEFPIMLHSDEDVQDFRRETVISHMQELVKGGLFPITIIDKEDPLSTEEDVDEDTTMLKVGTIIPELKSFCAVIELHVSRANYFSALRNVRCSRIVHPHHSAEPSSSSSDNVEETEATFEGSHRILSPGVGSSDDQSVLDLIIKSYDPAKRFFPRRSLSKSREVVVSVLVYPPSLLYNTGLEPVANKPRLLSYIEEPNVVKGFIKEPCFSNDGRLICSPFSYGVRLLTFSPEFQELSTCVPQPDHPVKLHEVTTMISHQNCVLSTKFSPKQYQLVSGCLNGQINWYQPVL